MKNRLYALVLASTLGLSLVLTGTAASHAQSFSPGFVRLEEDTFIRVPPLEFTIATLEFDRFISGVPFDLSRSERAFSQVRPSVNYDDGMLWLTFKYGKHRSLLSQLKNLSIIKRVKSSYRLASPSRYRIEDSSQMRDFSFTRAEQSAPRPKPRPRVPAETSSALAISEASPGALTSDRPGPGR